MVLVIGKIVAPQGIDTALLDKGKSNTTNYMYVIEDHQLAMPKVMYKWAGWALVHFSCGKAWI
jgi:hypothetical protein